MALAPPIAQDLVVVGATGDLSQRKLLPGLYNLEVDGLLPPEGRIVGYARHGITDEEFRNLAAQLVVYKLVAVTDAQYWGPALLFMQ